MSWHGTASIHLLDEELLERILVMHPTAFEKLIVDLMYEGGMSFMRYSISDTAEWGDYTKGPDIIGEDSRWAMQEALQDIQDGTFAKDWLLENSVGRPRFNALKRQNREHLIEEVGADLRAMMPWLKETK